MFYAFFEPQKPSLNIRSNLIMKIYFELINISKAHQKLYQQFITLKLSNK